MTGAGRDWSFPAAPDRRARRVAETQSGGGKVRSDMKSKSGFSQTPWHVENWDHVTLAWLKCPEGAADRRLIENAVETFGALKSALAILSGDSLNKKGLIEALKQGRNVIAKVEGTRGARQFDPAASPPSERSRRRG